MEVFSACFYIAGFKGNVVLNATRGDKFIPEFIKSLIVVRPDKREQMRHRR